MDKLKVSVVVNLGVDYGVDDSNNELKFIFESINKISKRLYSSQKSKMYM
jgi:hypothetical protein